MGGVWLGSTSEPTATCMFKQGVSEGDVSTSEVRNIYIFETGNSNLVNISYANLEQAMSKIISLSLADQNSAIFKAKFINLSWFFFVKLKYC